VKQVSARILVKHAHRVGERDEEFDPARLAKGHVGGGERIIRGCNLIFPVVRAGRHVDQTSVKALAQHFRGGI
jgi:hypothetical protein